MAPMHGRMRAKERESGGEESGGEVDLISCNVCCVFVRLLNWIDYAIYTLEKVEHSQSQTSNDPHRVTMQIVQQMGIQSQSYQYTHATYICT